jgi:outer membrane protein assembly factor BamB
MGRPLRLTFAALLALSATLLITACDPPSRYGPLHVEWSVKTGDTIAATPAFSNGKVYIGSWDGYEYAFDQASGAQRWRTFLGQYTNPACDTLGVTSSPAITSSNSAFLGGGDAYWYSLDTTTGAKQWSVFVGDPNSGHYNWVSPVTFNGYAYVGVSSLCDMPLVQGKLLRVNLTTHAVTNTWKVVPDGQTGGTIWTTPAVDKPRNKLYVTTGNKAFDGTGGSQKQAEAMVAVDATTLAVKDYWQLPASDPTPDADWGTGPVFLTDAQGRDLVAAGNKNGRLYAFHRDAIGFGPVWSRQFAQPAAGDEPGAGGLYSNGYFDGQRLYWAGGRTTVGGQTVDGSVRALDPATGAVIWEQPLPSKTFGSLTIAHGMLVVPSRTALRLLDPATGEVLYGNEVLLYAAARASGARLFLGDLGGTVRAYTLPPAPTSAARSASAVAPISCSSGPDCRVELAAGCQRLSGVGALAGRRVRVERVGDRRAAVRLALHAGDACSGAPLLRARLGSGDAVLPVPRSYRTGASLSVTSSRATRIRLVADSG